MIDGLLLLLELGLMLLLLLTIWRAQKAGREDSLGFFAYKPTLKPPPPSAGPPAPPRPKATRTATPGAQPASRAGGQHHA